MRGTDRYDEARLQRRLWTPSLLTTKVWWDALDSSTLTIVSGKISQWNDKSVNGYNASQATAANRPLYDAAGINSRPAVQFNAFPQVLTASTLPADPASSSLFALVRVNGLSATKPILCPDFSGGFFLRMNVTTGELILDKSFVVNIATASSANLGTLPYVAVVGCTYNSSSGDYNFYVNGLNTGSGTNAVAFTSSTSMEIGWDGGQTFDGWMGEIVRCDSILNASDRTKLEGYLAWKWGCQANFAGGHPYVNGPPLIGM